MTEPSRDRLTVTERIVAVISSLKLTDVLIMALLVVIAVPTYFAYRFIADQEFRREFLQNAVMVDKHVPCVVLEGHRLAQNTRHTILFAYAIEDSRMEKVIGLRAPGMLSDKEIDDACKRVIAMSTELNK
jgi:hypothetical protein